MQTVGNSTTIDDDPTTCSCAEYRRMVKRYNATRHNVHRSVSEECKRIS